MRTSILIGAVMLVLAGCQSVTPPAPQDPHASSALWPEKLHSADGFIVGEIHGTNEYPVAFLELVKSGPKPMLVGLELRESDADLPCASDNEWPDSWKVKGQDGRRSVAMFKLICALQKMEREGSVGLIYFDNRDGGNPTFYQNASKLIAAGMASDSFQKFAILSGNFHSQNDEGKLADLLEIQGLDVVTATGSAPLGMAWVCTQDGCGAKEFGSPFCETPTGLDQTTFSWTFGGEEGAQKLGSNWDACLNVARTTASEPASGQ